MKTPPGSASAETRIVLAALGALLLSTAAHAAEIRVLSTQAVEGAYRELVPQFEKASGHKLAAKSIGYASGPSGVYLTGLFRRLGIADQIKSKLKQTPTGVFVGSTIASGEVEIGFQQVSELAHLSRHRLRGAATGRDPKHDGLLERDSSR